MKIIFLTLVIFTVSINPQVTEEWVRTYSGLFSVLASASAIDENGNIYLAGSGTGSIPGTGSDFYTIKYNAVGALQWEATYDGGVYNHDWGYAIALDPTGNVYVTGESKGVINGFDSGSDYLTIKYDSQGNELWTQRYHGNNSFTSNNYDRPFAITADASGNVYVTGASWTEGQSNHDCLTVKYDTNGDLLWTARYNQPAPGAYGQDVKVDVSGNVYVFASAPSSTSMDYITIKYNSLGEQQWAKSYSEYSLVPSSMEIDFDGNVYVTGSGGSPTGSHTLKYDSFGDSLWCAVYTGISGAWPNDIAVDPQGNVYVTGRAVNAGYTGQEYVTIKYNSSGQEQWAVRYDGLGDDRYVSGAESITLDAEGNVYVTGNSQGANFLQGDITDYATVKYNNNGVEQWAVRYHRPPDGNEYAIGVHVFSDGKVYVSGSGMVSNNPTEMITIKYAQSPSDVSEISSAVPSNFFLSQNYPNPFNPSTTLGWQSPVGSWQTLKVYDLLGREVATLVDEFKPAGSYEVEFDASGLSSGVYYYRLISENFISTKKLTLIK